MDATYSTPQKIYHFHIPKTAGTTVNGWLDGCVHTDRARPADFANRWQLEWLGEETLFAEQDFLSVDYKDRLAAMKHYGVTWFDVLHGHISHLDVLPENRFVFTILRDPVARTISQYKDYRRLKASDYGHKFQAARKVHDCARQQDLPSFLQASNNNPFFRAVFEDGMCRFILQDQYSFEQFNALDVDERAGAASQFLEDHIDLVGVTEDLPNVMKELALRLGQVAPNSLPHSNQTQSLSSLDEKIGTYICEELCPADVQLYAKVRQDWGARDSTLAAQLPCDSPQFRKQLSKLSPITIGKEKVFDMNMPLIGQGFHSRDSAGETSCCRWMGPGNEATLYFPAPSDRPLVVRFFVAGWSDAELLKDLKIKIDGTLVEWSIEDRNNVFHALVVTTPKQSPNCEVLLPFRKVTFALQTLHQTQEDPRKRGFNLWRYSYECI